MEQVDVWRQFLETHGNAKREWTGRSTICLHNHKHIFNTKYEPDTFRIKEDRALSANLLKIPLIPRYIEIGTAMIGANYVEWQAVPDSVTREARMRADAVQVLIDQYERQNATFVNNQHIAASMLTLGHAAKRLYQDNDWQTIELEPEEAQIYAQIQEEGGVPIRNAVRTDNGNVRMEVLLPVIREQYLSPFRIVAESGVQDLESCNKFIVYEDRPRTDISRFFPGFDLESVKPDSMPDTNSPTGYISYSGTRRSYNQQTGSSYDAQMGLNRVYWCYERLNNGNWLQTIYIGSKMQTLLEEPAEIQFHPIVWYGAKGRQIDECFWQYGPVDRCVDLQRAINRSATDQKLNFHSLMKDAIMVPQSMKNQMTNVYGSLIFYNERSQQLPRRLDMPTNTHQMLGEMISRDEAMMARLMGINDMSQGVIKSHVSGNAAAQSINATASPLSLISDGIDAAELVKIKKVLRMQRSIFDEPRFFASVGKHAGETYARVVNRSDLMGYMDVRPMEVSRMPKEQQSRIQLGLQLAQSGMFSEENQSAVKKFREFVQIEKSTIPEGVDAQIEKHRALRALEMVRQGRVVAQGQMDPQTGQVVPAPLMYIDKTGGLSPLVGPLDMSDVHIEIISEAIREEQFADKQQTSMALALLKEHQTRVQNAQMERYSQQLELQAKQSVATQAGQLALQTQGAMLNSPTSVKSKMTPAQGGVLSGAVRRAN